MITCAIAAPRSSIRARLAPVLATRRWHLLALAGILGLSAVLGLYRIDAEGYSNTYYAATVRSMLTSWHAFFFASFDPGGFVTVDKPPLGYWVQALSAALFGFSGPSLLLPQVLAGVLSVGLLYALVARAFGRVAGLAAALGLALTPILVATNRNNTVDSLLVLTSLLAAYAVLRAAERASLRWLVLGLALVGVGFNIKMLQAYLILPALVLLYLVAAPARRAVRVAHLAIASVALVVVSLAWLVAVDLTPPSQRPYVGGSQTNSALELAFGYNGLGRLFGIGGFVAGGGPGDGPAGGVQPAPGAPPTAVGSGQGVVTAMGPGETGDPGPFRLFNDQLAGQISWLVPLAAFGAVAIGRRVGRWRALDARGRQLLLWSTWFLGAAAFFSVAGFWHRYYLVMLAPPIAALAGAGLVALWRLYRDGRRYEAALLPAALAVTAGVQVLFLGVSDEWSRVLSPVIAGVAVAAAAVLVVVKLVEGRIRQSARPAPAESPGPTLVESGPASAPAPVKPPVRRDRPARKRLAHAAVVVAFASLLAAPAVWGAIPVATAPGDILPAAGPRIGPDFGGPTAGGPGGAPGPAPAGAPTGPAAGGAIGPAPAAGPAGPAGGGTTGPGPGGGDGPSAGGPFVINLGGDRAGTADPRLVAYLRANRGSARFLVATTNWGSAAPIIIETGEPVMALHGFGTDRILTADQLAEKVRSGEVRFFLVADLFDQGPGGAPPTGVAGPGGSDDVAWVVEHCRKVPVADWSSDTGGPRPATGETGLGESLYDCAGA